MTITAKILAHSFNPNTNTDVVTFELEYPLVIHAHLLTHRVFSRNTASQRAIPVKAMIKAVMENPYIPIKWGKNQAGMVAKDEEIENIERAKAEWLLARDDAVYHAGVLDKMGLHKQHTNRLLAPFQHTKVVVTTTELDNFFNLRLASDAQPEVQELAKVMKEAYEDSVISTLLEGEWHLPYIEKVPAYDAEGNPTWQYFYQSTEISLEDAKAISAACCAAVSYRMEDISVSKAQDIYKKLGVGTNKFHASPFEHVCTPWQEHEEVEKGNLLGFHQLRHLL